MSQRDFKLLMLPPSSDLFVLGSQAWTTMPTSMRKGVAGPLCESASWCAALICVPSELYTGTKHKDRLVKVLLANLFLFFAYEAFPKEVCKGKTLCMWAGSLKVAQKGESKLGTSLHLLFVLAVSEHRVSSCFMLQVSSLP